MKDGMRVLLFVVVCLWAATNLCAQEAILPAGTLVNCTLDEPNLSSQTVQIDDPVICRVGQLGQFGRATFPRGAYLAGRLAEYDDPGRFFGKGWMRLEFDRVVLPNAAIPISGKMIAVRGYGVDRQGRLLGRGHPKRDAILWSIPVFWPVKLITLPARGPRPALKGETRITVRLMDDLSVPVTASVNPASGWRRFERPTSLSGAPRGVRDSSARTTSRIRYAGVSIPSADGVTQGFPGGQRDEIRSNSAPSLSESELPQDSLPTLLVLKNQRVVAAKDYWLKEGSVHYETSSGGTESVVGVGEVDWRRTIHLNAERGVKVVVRRGP